MKKNKSQCNKSCIFWPKNWVVTKRVLKSQAEVNMVIEKEFKCTFKDIDSVIVALAEEIKNGWRVDSIKHGDFTFSVAKESYAEFSVTLVRGRL